MNEFPNRLPSIEIMTNLSFVEKAIVHDQAFIKFNICHIPGPRACYDEGKRVAETLAYSYAKQEKVSVRVARIFNTYGPRMHVSDGRVVSNFIMQALQNLTITVRIFLYCLPTEKCLKQIIR